ncbi:hypothetical protein VTP01DRAFT_10955 [Rhizomucor pusillus]|uniref:uncharacterized protein n=1 Tax=Rhizomucor pusillus TaxID=4840 RepID=UPI00374412A2
MSLSQKERTELLQKYEDFINTKLKPNLKTVLDARDETFNMISEYQKLRTQIELIKEHDLKELKTMVDLGAQFYVQAHVPETKFIYVNVGFGFHVQFTLDEALAFIDKKEKKLEEYVVITNVLGAISEVLESA